MISFICRTLEVCIYFLQFNVLPENGVMDFLKTTAKFSQVISLMTFLVSTGHVVLLQFHLKTKPENWIMLGSCSWKIPSPETNTATTDDQRAWYMGKYIRLMFERNKILLLILNGRNLFRKISILRSELCANYRSLPDMKPLHNKDHKVKLDLKLRSDLSFLQCNWASIPTSSDWMRLILNSGTTGICSLWMCY